MVGLLAQRLVRVLCPVCKVAAEPDVLEQTFLGARGADAPIYRANGCDECGRSGFKGRTGIYELVTVDEGLRERIHDQASEQEMVSYVRAACPSIADDGRRKVLAGITSVHEVMRVSLAD